MRSLCRAARTSRAMAASMSLRGDGSGRNLRNVGSRKSGTPSRSTSRAANRPLIASGRPWRRAIANAIRSSANRSAQRRPVSDRSTPSNAARAARTSEDISLYRASRCGRRSRFSPFSPFFGGCEAGENGRALDSSDEFRFGQLGKTVENGEKRSENGGTRIFARAMRFPVHNSPLEVDGSDADGIGISTLTVHKSGTPPGRCAQLAASSESRSTTDRLGWAYATLPQLLNSTHGLYSKQPSASYFGH